MKRILQGLVIPKPALLPQGNLASHILGFAGDYNQGLEGIELLMINSCGHQWLPACEYDAAGHEIPESTRKYIQPEQGQMLF